MQRCTTIEWTKRVATLTVFLLLAISSRCLLAQDLEILLQQESLADLAREARQKGDPGRGAIIFHQPGLACSRCHAIDEPSRGLGPDLTALGNDVSDESLIESVLYPSKTIAKEFESISIWMLDGRVFSGIVAERTDDTISLRDASGNGELMSLAVAEIDEIKRNGLSIMPDGQINQLKDRQQFYDLIKYLSEIRDGGRARAAQLQPTPSALAWSLPEYEQRVDHAGLIRSWDDQAFRRGEAIYQRVCANCHGTHDQPGSLPTSLRFADGLFKNGSDPLSIYRTLTHGYGQMAPQTWMVPRQKYDVVHYLRESYLKPFNPKQFVVCDEVYLSSLPQGDTFGPEPSTIEAWSAMDYGPSLTHTYEIPGTKKNIAYKGIAVRLDPGPGGISRGRQWMVFDTDTLRVAAGWESGPDLSNRFIDWRAIQFNGEHGVHPSIVGDVIFSNSNGPGWAHPETGLQVDDQRILGRDGRRYGPLPPDWGKFKGLYHHGQRTVLSYSVGSADILEWLHGQADEGNSSRFIRSFSIGPRERDLILQIAETAPETRLERPFSQHPNIVRLTEQLPDDNRPTGRQLIAGTTAAPAGTDWLWQDGNLRFRIPAGNQAIHFSVWLTDKLPENSLPGLDEPAIDLSSLVHGGTPRWPTRLVTNVGLGTGAQPFLVDVLTAPEINPWLAQLRFTGLDFFPDGRIAICSWDGDVWVVTPSASAHGETLEWQRVASGLFQPLGLKICNGRIHLTCRDQLAVLHDLNGDGETDFYECLNHDHQVTEHFHEFAMGLQADAAGNFYYAKSGCHGKAAIVPQHGTLLKVSADGSRTEILANGFRAANGVCLNPDGSFVVTDQEGFWNPKNRINWVVPGVAGKPKFYGNMLGYHDVTDPSDAAMEPPLCWITNEFDRSPAELVWVDSPAWGPLGGGLLNLSYGYGKVFLVLHEEVDGIRQGGMVELPIPAFPTGIMRGRFHPGDGQFYTCGMFAWAGNAIHPGGLYRIRYQHRPLSIPLRLHAWTWGVEIAFSESLDPEVANNPKNYAIKVWDLHRSARYGSDHLNERTWKIKSARLTESGNIVQLEIPEIAPTWGMELIYDLRGADGSVHRGKIHNTIHRLRAAD